MMSTIGYITDENFTKRLKAILRDESFAFDDIESSLITTSITDAYNLIRSKLISRGVSPTDILNWSRGAEFQSDIAVYMYCISTGLHQTSQNTEDQRSWWKEFDRRKELDTVEVVLGDDSPTDAAGLAHVINLVDVNNNLGI